MTSPIGQKPRTPVAPPSVKTSSAPASSNAVATTTNKPKLEGHGPKLPKLSADGLGQAVKNQFGKTGQAAFKAGSVLSGLKNDLKNSKINQALDSKIGKGIGHGIGGAGSAVGLAGGLKDLVDGIKSGDGQKIAGGALGSASATLGATAAGIESGVFGKIGQGFKNLLGGAGKGAEAAKGASTALKAGETAGKIGAEVAGKGAARFVPGLNIGIAALDSANAIRTLKDPSASVGAKVTSGVTALGSIAAATNIPIVSQVGAGISALSGIAGGVLGFLGK